MPLVKAGDRVSDLKPIFRYGETEIRYLQKKDKILGREIERIGMIRREVTPDLFTALISSIVGQQISGKAKDTVWQRLLDRLGGITPQSLAQANFATVQGCGMTMRKAAALQDVAVQVLEGKFDIDGLAALSDDELCKRLSSLKGVGEWTAEMLMIFSLERPNVLSYGDLAIRRGIMKLYRHKELDRARFERYRKRYSPYCSVASLYLWELAVEI